MIHLLGSQCLLTSFPSELFTEVLKYLDLKGTLSLRSVCHYFIQKCDITATVQRRCKDVQPSNPRFARFQIIFKGFVLYTDKIQIMASLALKCGLVESFHFNTLRAYDGFEEKSLLEEVFVRVQANDTRLNFSNIDFQFVDKIFISVEDSQAGNLLRNKSFISINWKCIHFEFKSLPSSLNDYAKLISSLNFEELLLTTGNSIHFVCWDTMLGSLDEGTRKKIKIEGYLFKFNLPDITLIRSVHFGSPQSIDSNILLQFIQERPLLKELEVRFQSLKIFEQFLNFIQSPDLEKLDRELKITLCYEDPRSGEYLEYFFPPQ